ncbi:unnamed protein product [Trichobilharzia szidati]|nr:unnamed protein product [Trichobilharzia szidati]
MTCESLLGLEDAMDEFLQSVDLFDDIDVGELDFASKASELLENSDSDSGISVAGEKQLQQLEDNGQRNYAVSDYVLTDVVGSAAEITHSILQTNNGSSGYEMLINTKGTPGGGLIQTSSPNVSPPKFKQVTVSTVGGKNLPCNPPLRLNLNGGGSVPMTGAFRGSLKLSSTPVKLSAGNITSFTRFPNVSSGSSTSSPVKLDSECRSLDELFSGTNEVAEVYEYCGNPASSDPSLQEHLRNVNCTPYSNSSLGSRSQLSPTSLLDMQDFLGPNECIISHANLERIRKKQERMIKNRQAACLSRLRKKEYLERLEMKFEQLKRENLALWRQNEEWRLRCSHLERCIEDLQSQFPNSTSSEEVNIKREPVESSTTGIPSSLQSSNAITNTTYVNPVSVHRLIPKSETAVGFKSTASSLIRPSSFNESGRSKTVSIRNWKDTQDKNMNPQITVSTTVNPVKTLKWSTSPKRIFLSNKIDVESHSQLSSQQSPVPRSSITRTLITSNNRFTPSITHRSKVIATTSLLAIFGLFTLNIFSFSDSNIGYNILPSLSSIGMFPSSDQIISQKFAFANTNAWASSIQRSVSGKHLSINIQSTQEDILTDQGGLIKNSSNNKVLTSETASVKHSTNNCGPNKNISCSENASFADVRQILQGWIERHAISTSNQSAIYRLLLTPSIHNLKAFGNQQSVFTPSSILSRNSMHDEQNPFPLPVKHLDNQPSRKSIPYIARRRDIRQQRSSSADDVDRRMLNMTANSAPPRFTSSHRSPVPRKYDIQDDDNKKADPYVHPAVRAFENLFSVVDRRNDTAYIVFLNRDHFLLPSIDPLPANMRQKMTFLLPAHRVINGSHNSSSNANNNDDDYDYENVSASTLSMLQLDCEVINATLLHTTVYPDNR